MKHPALFGVRMAKRAGSEIYQAVSGIGTAFRLSAVLFEMDGLWLGEIALNGVPVYRSPRGFKSLERASDALAAACGALESSAEAMANGRAVADPWGPMACIPNQ